MASSADETGTDISAKAATEAPPIICQSGISNVEPD